jgi:hypothetical protein
MYFSAKSFKLLEVLPVHGHDFNKENYIKECPNGIITCNKCDIKIYLANNNKFYYKLDNIGFFICQSRLDNIIKNIIE